MSTKTCFEKKKTGQRYNGNGLLFYNTGVILLNSSFSKSFENLQTWISMASLCRRQAFMKMKVTSPIDDAVS